MDVPFRERFPNEQNRSFEARRRREGSQKLRCGKDGIAGPGARVSGENGGVPGIVVTLPAPLHRAAGGRGELVAAGETVADVLAALRRDHPVVARLFLKETGEPRGAVRLVLNGSDVRALQGLETPLKEGDRLAVVLLVAGG